MVFASPCPFRAFAGARDTLLLAICLCLRGRQIEKQKAVPLCSGCFLRDCTQRSVNLTLEFEPFSEDLHDDPAALVLALQISSRRRQPRIDGSGHLPADAESGVQG